jgi:hypothetical protein
MPVQLCKGYLILSSCLVINSIKYYYNFSEDIGLAARKLLVYVWMEYFNYFQCVFQENVCIMS